DCLADGSLAGSDQQSIDHWFDKTAYSTPAALNPTKPGTAPEGRIGTCGRNTLRGPDYVDFDMGLARTFDFFGEGRHLEFRWEMFNMLNTPQFGLPSANISNSSTAGVISTLSGDPRVMQFALKFVF
ncbi:MAG: hypothetical protein J2P31_10095, partial [Blastocatellia bacterium]|nr:hypothetical protein [Blastocatellia bacterium]